MKSKLVTTKNKDKSVLYREEKQNKMIRVSRGVYSKDIYYDLLEVYSLRYPYGIFTLNTLFSIYGMTDRFIDKYHLTTKRGTRTIKDNKIVQTRQVDRTFNIGKINYNHKKYNINVYDKERLLIELFRFSSRLPRSLYKEVIRYYRNILNTEFNVNKYQKYCEYFKERKMLIDRFRREIQ